MRSAPEADVRRLILSSRILPEPLWNPLIQLPDGRKISPDALFVDAAMVHEVNGRDAHAEAEAGEDAFEDMHVRADAMVTGGLTVLGNTPRRISTYGPDVLQQLETCYLRERGKGLPPGVIILRAGPPGTPSNATLLAL